MKKGKLNNVINRLKKPAIGLFMASALLFGGVGATISPTTAHAESPLTMTFTTNETQLSSQTLKARIPDLTKVVSVTTNTGTVSYSRSGEDLTFQLSNGTYSSRVWNTTKYSKTGYDRQIRSTNSGFSSSLPYSDSQGYTGTVYPSGSPYIYSGAYYPADTIWVTAQDSSYYNYNGYSGSLSSYLYGSEYVSSSTMWVTNQSSSYYNSGGYSGTLSQYQTGGSYTPADSKYISSYVGKTQTGYCDTRMGSDWQGCNPKPPAPGSVYYSSGGYSGTLYYSSYNYYQSPLYSSGNGHQRFDFERTWYYAGTVTKPAVDTRTYAYQGNVTKPGYYVNVYKYQGNVTKPAYDNRQYAQDYSGTVYKADYDYYYKYSVTVQYWTDSTPPTLDLQYDDSSIVNKSVIRAVGSDSNSGIYRIQLPNGSWVYQSTVDYPISANGEYSFVAEDNAGNQTRKSIVVSNIDTQAPNQPTINLNENWTNQNVTATLYSNGDNGASGVKGIEYSLSGANSQSWTEYTGAITLSSEGKTVVSARVLDKAGNYSAVVTKEAKIDKTKPMLSVTSNIINLTNTDIILTAKATDSLSGVKRIQLPNGNWVNAGTVDYTVGENGTYIFKTEDNAGNITSVEHNVRNIKKNVLITNKQEVDLELHAEDLFSGVTHMQFRNEETSWSVWEAYSPRKSWVLSPVDGLKHVWVQYRDKVGNVSPSVEDIIILDTTKPTISLFQINNNDVYTKSKEVTLKVKGSDSLTGIKDLYVSNNNVDWVKMDYTEEIPWVLSGGDGVKTVYLKISDIAGNISNVATDTIFLDTTKPLANIIINNGDSYTATRDVRLTLTYSDIGGSGIDKVKVIEGDQEYTLPAPTPNSPITIPWTLDFGVVKTVSIVSIDKAGNVSNMAGDSIIVDRLTIKEFTLENVVNPLVFDTQHPFTPKTWAFAPQPMLAGGNITFSIDIKQAMDASVIEDSVNYKAEVVGDNDYYRVFIGKMKKAGDHYTQTLMIPKDAPNGAKVYVNATAQRKLLVTPYDTQTVYFPGADASAKAQIGVVGENIYDVIRFNEIQ